MGRLVLMVAYGTGASSVASAAARQAEFGKIQDGTVQAVELTNSHGISARIITLGAAIQSLQAPDRNGVTADIVLGYATPAEYIAKPQYFGATVGRYANRIAAGTFALDGKRYTLAKNDGPNHLHGGVRGFDKVLWKIESIDQAAAGKPSKVVLSYTSPDGEEGYPGTLQLTATYTLNEDNELAIEYRATTDKPTVVNITNHSYFNLGGENSGKDVLGHRLTLLADAYTPVDKTLIPTGERRAVAGTPFDFRTAETLGRRIRDGKEEQLVLGRGYDHTYIVNGVPGTLRMAARVEDPASGRVLELLTTAPGVQLYSGNFLDGTSIGKSGHVYRQSDALCLEPGVFPDTHNRKDFPTSRLDPGATYSNRIVYRLPAPK
jgi:aldose 1-epimerase